MKLDCSEIIAGRLWVGRFVRPEEVPVLKDMGITSVLSLQSDWDVAGCNLSQSAIYEAYGREAIEARRIPVPDFDKHALANSLPAAVEELGRALALPSSRAYIHCTAGINRAPTLAAAYLIRKAGMSSREAYEFVVARRDCSPYLYVLQEYEASLEDEP
jgi:protein-tyrosine phosphatase